VINDLIRDGWVCRDVQSERPADELAKAWSDESLVTWYQGERRKVTTALADTAE